MLTKPSPKRPAVSSKAKNLIIPGTRWLRELDLNQRPSGYDGIEHTQDLVISAAPRMATGITDYATREGVATKEHMLDLGRQGRRHFIPLLGWIEAAGVVTAAELLGQAVDAEPLTVARMLLGQADDIERGREAWIVDEAPCSPPATARRCSPRLARPMPD